MVAYAPLLDLLMDGLESLDTSNYDISQKIASKCMYDTSSEQHLSSGHLQVEGAAITLCSHTTCNSPDSSTALASDAGRPARCMALPCLNLHGSSSPLLLLTARHSGAG